MGAELLLRLGEFEQAQAMYEAVVAAKTLPWARLGIARAQLDSGQAVAAVSLLDNLIREDPSFADAYDVLGRAQFELGRFDQALATYKMAAELTPSSVSRLQNLGMISFYAGDRQQAEKVLERAARLGLGSKMFDCQSIVLLAFTRLESGDKRGLQQCREDFARLLERQPDSARFQRLAEVVETLSLIQSAQFGQAVEAVRRLVRAVPEPDFDFESATNLLTLLSQLAARAIQLDDVERSVDALALRFCTSRPLAELLAGACAVHPPYAERVRDSNAQVLKLTEAAVGLSLAGDPRAAAIDLLQHGKAMANAKMLETAYLVLQRYAAKIGDAAELTAQVQALRAQFFGHASKPGMGDTRRQAGGLTLRTGSKPKAPNPSVMQS